MTAPTPKADIEDALGLTYEERHEVRMHIDRMRMARTLAPLPGAIDGVLKLSQIAEIFFITSRLSSSQTWCWDRSAWLNEQLGPGWGKRAQYVKHKWLVDGDVFVDDSPSNVMKWARAKDGVPILWEQHYNFGHEFDLQDSNIIKSNDWGYIEALARTLSSQK